MAQNFKVPLGLYAATSDPSTPTVATGDIYYNSSANELRVYNGTAWQAVGGGGAVDANTLTGTTLASNVVNSSLTSFGSSPTITTPILTLSATTSNTIGRIAWDNTNSQIEIGNGSALKIFTADDATATLTNKTISGASNTVSTTGTLTIGSGLSGGSFNGSSNVTISLTNNSVTVNGTAISLGSSGTITAANPNALTIGTGLSGTSYNGSSAVTIAINSDVVTLTDTQTLTNKTITQPTLRLLNATSTGFASGNIIYNSNTEEIQYSQGNSARTVVDTTLTQTLSNKTLSSATLTGTLTAGGSVGTSGQVLQSTGTGVQWATPGGGSAATPTALGTIYGSSSTTSTARTAIGYQAAESVTTGQFATAIGFQALQSLTTSNHNTAIGAFAGLATVAGSANTSIGSNALRTFTSTRNGASNVAVGAFTLYSAGAISNNTAVGTEALINLATGSGANVAVGRQAGYSLSSGNNNIFIGNSSGFQTTGNQNVLIGNQTCYNMQGASQNTAIGHSAGFASSADANVSGANNTFIGYFSVGTSTTASNVITLGNSSITTLRCQVTSITALSDRRDKKNVENLNIGLSFINKLRPVKFTWDTRPILDYEGNPIPEAGGKHNIDDYGFIAQELLETEQEFGVQDWTKLVETDNPDKLEATPGKLIPVLVKAIQELSAKVAELEAKI